MIGTTKGGKVMLCSFCLTKSAWRKIFSSLLVLLVFSNPAWAQSERDNAKPSVEIASPGIDLWRNVRQRDSTAEGISQVRGIESGVLINPQATRWSGFRSGALQEYGFALLVAVPILIFLFYLFRGKLLVAGGLSGAMVKRFSDYEKVVHWTLAIVFLLLAATGLILLFGRELLIPLFGRPVFSLLASASKEAHNLFGPLFLVSLLLMIYCFLKRNLYERGDLKWLLQGGGMIGNSHASGGFFNMGEKSWYWLVVLIGLVISASGLVLLFPNLSQSRVVVEISHVIHASTAILLIAVSFGHMYLATLGTEGTSEGMKSGYVDINWARSHHDRWAEECEQAKRIIPFEEFSQRQGSIAKNSQAGGKTTTEDSA